MNLIKRAAMLNSMKTKSPAQQWVDGITVGWNLGNTLDSTGSNVHTEVIGTSQEATYYETLWGCPVTTKAMIDTVKAKGFNAIRIPVTWAHHLDNNFNISSYWMDRVVEVVDYVISNNMRCIINTHHDHSNYGDGKNWLNADPSANETVCANFAKVWTQIANRFKNYDTKLLVFEGYNELLTSVRSWAPPTESEYNALNNIAQTFVDAVRGTGGNNLNRILSINTYGSMVSKCQYFKMPTDIQTGYLFVQVHFYDEKGNQETESLFTTVDAYFGSNGIPVIIGEFGTELSVNYEFRILHARNFVSRVIAHGYRCFVWDNNYTWRLLNRTNLTWYYDDLVNAIIDGSHHLPVYDTYLNTYTYNSMTSFNYGALDTTNGNATTFTSGAITFKTRFSVNPFYQYTIIINSSDNGFRVYKLYWWDVNGNYIGYTQLPDTSLSPTIIAPYNARYLNFYVYNPWQTITEASYTSLLANNTLLITVKEASKPSDTSTHYYLSSINLSNISNWVSGDFDVICSRPIQDASRIHSIGYLECDGNKEYKISISNQDIGLIVREVNIHKDLVIDHNYCTDGMYITTSDRTKYVALVLYSLTNNNVTYDYFQNAFSSNLTISMTESANPNLTGGYFNISTINLKDIRNYRTGSYDTTTGLYSNAWDSKSNMCVGHLIQVSPNTLYTPTLSTGFVITIQEYNSTGSFVRNIGLIKNGGLFVTSASAKYISVTLNFYDSANYHILPNKQFIDFYNTFNDTNFTIGLAVSSYKANVFTKANGQGGYSLSSSTGLPYSVSDTNYAAFNPINVTSLTSKDILIYPSTGGIYLAQFDVNGVCIVKPSGQTFGNQPIILDNNTTSIRFCCTWMNASSTIILAYNSTKDITLDTPPSGSIVVFDDFNRANNSTTLGVANTGQTWLYVNSIWGIQNNKAVTFSATNIHKKAIINAGISNAIVSVTFPEIPSLSSTRLIFRYVDDSNEWFVYDNYDTYRLCRRISGNMTELYVSTIPIANGDKVTVVCNGANIKAYINNVKMCELNDSSLQTATKYGFEVYKTGSTFDDFKVESIL